MNNILCQPMKAFNMTLQKKRTPCINLVSSEEDLDCLGSSSTPKRLKISSEQVKIKTTHHDTAHSTDSSNGNTDGTSRVNLADCIDLCIDRAPKSTSADIGVDSDISMGSCDDADSDGEEMDLGSDVESDDDYEDPTESSLPFPVSNDEPLLSAQREHELRLWRTSPMGRSQKFADEITSLAAELAKDLGNTRYRVEFVSRKLIIEFCTKLLYKQQAFAQTHGKTRVTIGYHWTSPVNMPKISENGLLTRDDQSSLRIVSSGQHGEAFGRGIYTGNNPFTFSRYGTTGLLCAVLHGEEREVCSNSSQGIGFDTAFTGRDDNAQIILKSSDQIAPVWSFVPELIGSETGHELLWSYHEALAQAIDLVLNKVPDNSPVEIRGTSMVCNAFDILHSRTGMASQLPTETPTATVHNTLVPKITLDKWKHLASAGHVRQPNPSSAQPRVMQPGVVRGKTTYIAPDDLSGLDSDVYHRVCKQDISPEPCTVCLEDLPNNADSVPVTSDSVIDLVGSENDSESAGACVALKVCGHQFHEACLKAALSNSSACAICRAPVSREAKGTQPTGTMSYVFSDNNHCLGYENVGIVTITYTLYSGVQKKYHPSPGVNHAGATRVAYLPNNQEGRLLLNRLVYAFEHGLTFTVGTSYTTGQPNQVTWGSVHHKTSLVGGALRHGFPDPGYFINANEELTSKGVPAVCPALSLSAD